MVPTLAALSAAWLANPWLLWGLGPQLCVVAGFWATAALGEALLATRWLDGALLAYPSAEHGGGLRRRGEALAKTRARIPLRKQAWTALVRTAGPELLPNAFVLALVMRAAGAWRAAAWWPTSLLAGAAQALAFALVADLGLYLGHRAMHESETLWRVHRVHHAIDTPTPFSTIYIHGLDVTLQAGLPLALASALVRPAPGVLYLSFAAHVAENAVNHLGLDHWLVNLVTLKVLPFRAPISFHDAHHKQCNYKGHAKNYGEAFWLWDWAFGTMSPRAGRRQGSSKLA